MTVVTPTPSTPVPAAFQSLSSRLDERAGRLAVLNAYYAGDQPLSFLSPDARKRLGDRLDRVSVNIPRLVVDTLVERLRIVGFTVNGKPAPELWATFLRCHLDQLLPVAFRESLTLGSSFVFVWADAQGRATATVESASQVAVALNPATRRVTSALKRWEDDGKTHAVFLEPDQIRPYASSSPGATTTGWSSAGPTLDNPLGEVPVVPLVNASRLLDTEGTSEMQDVLALADAIIKLTTDMLTASEYEARPRRWASGVEDVEEEVLDAAGNPVLDEYGQPVVRVVNPFPETDRMMTSDSPEAKFGQLPGGGLTAYENAIGVLFRQVSAVTGLPGYVLGIGGDSNPSSADSMRAADSARTARAESAQRVFGRAVEHVARLMLAVESGADPDSFDVAVQWADASTRSVAQEADAVVKLVQSGVLPVTYALKRLGYSDTEVEDIRRARRTEALDATGMDLLAPPAPPAVTA